MFEDVDPLTEVISFDKALLAELRNAKQNLSARRVYDEIARAAAETWRAAKAQPVALD